MGLHGAYLRLMSYREALSSVAARTSLPFGYSIGVFSAGQLLIGQHGSPSLVDLLLYALGAAAAYVALRVDSPPPASAQPPRPHSGLVGILHVVTIIGAIAAAALAARIPGEFAWPAGGLVLTAVYLGASALEDVLPLD